MKEIQGCDQFQVLENMFQGQGDKFEKLFVEERSEYSTLSYA